MNRAATLLCIMLIAATVGGCLRGGEIDPTAGQGDIEITFDRGIEAPYVLMGTVDFELNSEDPVSFRDVMLCLYGSDGSLINATKIGTFASPGSEHSFRITSPTRPRYIVVDHPQFREYDRLAGGVITWTSEYVREENAGPEESINTFEYHPPTEPGECGRSG